MNSPYQLITTNEQLRSVFDHFTEAPALAIDTEFIRERYYYPRLELAQITDGRQIALIDMRGSYDSELFRRLLNNPRQTKILHDARQDFQVLRHEFEISSIEPVFDTQLAAAIAGFGFNLSLNRLIDMALKISVSKGNTLSNWEKRPLDPDQLYYAAQDVAHLHALQDCLSRKIASLNRESWLIEDQTRQLDAFWREEQIDDAERFWRVSDCNSLDPPDLAILRELASWRESLARTNNIDRFSILKDWSLIQLARFKPQTREQLKEMRLIGNALRYADDIFQCIERGRQVPESQWPRKWRHESRTFPDGVVELCSAVIQLEAARRQVPSELVATKKDIREFLKAAVKGETPDIPLITGWRFQVGGAALLKFLHGESFLGFNPDGTLKMIDNPSQPE